jgi:hypothetical protein
MWEHRALPVPDPFAFTTLGAPSAYPGEDVTRRFNLTHEWLSQLLIYLLYRAAGFPGIVLFRAAMLAAFCGLAGVIARRRGGGFYGSLAAALATATIAAGFAYDRPYLVSFLFLAATVAILEFRRWLWLLPLLFLVWANSHGGYLLGWIALGAYSLDALVRLWRKKPEPGDTRLLIISVLAFLITGANPNFFRLPQVLMHYRTSYLTSRLLEWSPPSLRSLNMFTVLLFGVAVLLLWKRGSVRLTDWLLFVAFAAAALTAQRNIILIGFLAPILIVTYFPWRGSLPQFAQAVAGAALIGGLVLGIASGSFFQLRAAEWKYPGGAADFLIAHHVTGRIFNTYEYGGYLIWRLWPQNQVFIDGRALSEWRFMDYARILYNHDDSGGKDALDLLDQYDVQAIVMNTFEYSGGLVYLLAPGLWQPPQTKWKLVYDDPASLIFMRDPPPGVPLIEPARILDHMEAECDLHLQREPQYPLCARSLGQLFARVGDRNRTRKWLGIYLSYPHAPDVNAERTYQQLVTGGN